MQCEGLKRLAVERFSGNRSVYLLSESEKAKKCKDLHKSMKFTMKR